MLNVIKSIITMFAIFFSSITGQQNLELSDLLNNKLKEIVTNFNIVGISSSVNINDETTWVGTAGYSNPDNNEIISSDMFFGIASITKTFTSALILKLSEENGISLDDSLHKYLQDFQNVNSSVTIRELLNHTTGIFDFTSQAWVDSFMVNPSRIWTPEEVIEIFVDEPIFEPGEAWSYSNTNYLLLGLILEEITGSTYHQLLRDYIFEPFTLTSTFLDPQESLQGNYADNWFDLNGDQQIENISSISKDGFNSSAWAAGSITSTAEDVAKWGYNLFNLNFISQESLNKMTDFIFTGEDNFDYGLGLMNFNDFDNPVYGHTGQTIGYTSVLLFDAQNNVSLSVLVNQDSDTESIGKELLEVVNNYLNTITSIDGQIIVPDNFVLEQNYPNPFNPETKIRYSIPVESRVNITVHNTLGQLVELLENNVQNAGTHELNFDASNLSSGVYIYRINAESIDGSKSFDEVNKMILLK